jgi:hypothetical protein
MSAGRKLRRRAAGAAIVSGLILGVRDVLRPEEAPPIVVEYRNQEPLDERVVLFFHPQVPEATLVLLR